MKAKHLLLFMAITLIGCDSSEMNSPNETDKKAVNHVLLLQVDYTTNKFEGGTEFNFSKQTNGFTIVNEYKAPGDFGWVKLIYKELNELLFEGTIHWMGTGKMIYPDKLEPANYFESTLTQDVYLPGKGFENIQHPNSPDFEEEDYLNVWLAVQYLVKVREYLDANTDQQIKIFLYTPSVGVGDPLTWKWLIFLNK
jgi:hypothetical protein